MSSKPEYQVGVGDQPQQDIGLGLLSADKQGGNALYLEDLHLL